MVSGRTPDGNLEPEITPEHRATITLVRRLGRARKLLGFMMVGILGAVVVADVSTQWNPTETVDDWVRGDGDPSSYKFIEVQEGNGQPVAYDPCQPIYYVVNPGKAPEELQHLLNEAITVIEQHTGLDFVFEGEDTDARVDGRRRYMPEKYGQRWSPVLIEFSDAVVYPFMTGTVLGGANSRKGNQDPYYVSGAVVFDTPEMVSHLDGPYGSDDVLDVLVHELAHLVGLDHVEDETQLMFEAYQGQLGLGAGDREGLKRLGSVPCATSFPSPTATAPR